MNTLSDRTISAFPLSIGTSLAFESIFNPKLEPYDKSRIIPNKIELSKYEEIYINLSTLFRNLSGSVNKDIFYNTNENNIKLTLENEIETIYSLFKNEGLNKVRPVYYYCSYKSLYTSLLKKRVLLRKDTTDGQLYYTHKLVTVMKLLLKNNNFIETDHLIQPKVKNKSLILTHSVYDLLNYEYFDKLDLLESHTGVLKPRHLWNTKYINIPGENLSVLPFNKKIYYLFGDKLIIQPADLKLRKLILDIAKKQHWTAMTTIDKVMLDLEIFIKEPFVVQFIKNL